jgi:SnoaL-like domain
MGRADHIESIRACAHRYCRGVDRVDLELMKSAYWPGAIDDHGVYVGDAMAFCERVVVSHRRYESTMHCILNHAIELEPDEMTAHGEIYNISYLLRRNDEDRRIMDTWWGRYLDRYERRGDEWRIAHRICVHEWDRSEPIVMTMPAATDLYRQGSVDRATPMPTPLGR